MYNVHRTSRANNLSVKLWLFSYPLVKTCVVGAQKSHLIETVLMSTHNICYGTEIREIIFRYTL